jgi:hypothetical protein
LSQQLQWLERELNVLLDCTTHHVELTSAGPASPSGAVEGTMALPSIG